MHTMFDNAKWLRLYSQKQVVINGQDYTEEVWIDAMGRKSEIELVPRQREWYGKRN